MKVACTVLNGGDEETYHKATRLVPTQRNLDPDILLLAMSANLTETRLDKTGSKTDCMHRCGMHEGTQVNLHYPV